MSMIAAEEADRLYELERLVRAWADARTRFDALDNDSAFEALISTSMALRDFAAREIKPLPPIQTTT